MREIKLRAKDTLTEEWIYSNGYYFDEYNYWFILPTDKPNVDKALAWTRHRIIKPETIGQFTGLRDKNGKEIYEGDIVNLLDGHRHYNLNERTESTEEVVLIYWEDRELAFRAQYKTKNIWSGGSTGAWIYCRAVVIGNIHENPELLK